MACLAEFEALKLISFLLCFTSDCTPIYYWQNILNIVRLQRIKLISFIMYTISSSVLSVDYIKNTTFLIYC
jgi:hypothetical protein